MNKLKTRFNRKYRVRNKTLGTGERPRLSVDRTNRYIYAQVIDDDKKVTLIGISEKELKKEDLKKNKTEKANLIGILLGEKLIKIGVKKVVFDRGEYKYHGRVKALAEGVRSKGLAF